MRYRLPDDPGGFHDHGDSEVERVADVSKDSDPWFVTDGDPDEVNEFQYGSGRVNPAFATSDTGPSLTGTTELTYDDHKPGDSAPGHRGERDRHGRFRQGYPGTLTPYRGAADGVTVRSTRRLGT